LRGGAKATQLTQPVGERDHILGPPAAPVTLLEYGDFECPFCRMAYPAVKELRRQLSDRLRFVFRHFPRPEHPHARHAAEAAEASAAQGRFWEMHDLLFKHQQALEDDHLLQYAAELGLDSGRFGSELAGHLHRDRVQADVLSAIASGSHGTPTFFINGLRHEGAWQLDDLRTAVEAAEPGE
jgi:protein-disulfide isomerase